MTDVVAMRNAVYCAHIHLEYLYPDDVIRASVRVYWVKRKVANGATFASYGFGGTGICTTGAEVAIGRDTENFHWIYMASAIAKVTAQ